MVKCCGQYGMVFWSIFSNLEICRLDPVSGTCLGCGFNLYPGHIQEATNLWFSLSKGNVKVSSGKYFFLKEVTSCEIIATI